jgi:hypothetical protein
MLQKRQIGTIDVETAINCKGAAVEAADNKTHGKQRQGSTNNGLRLSLGPARQAA